MNKKIPYLRRLNRVRSNIKKKAFGRMRLSVFRSNTNISAQLIDDSKKITVAAASSLEKYLKKLLKNGGNIKAAQAVGKLIAERAKKAGVTEVVFDRGAYIYHGRVKALAETARENGLKF
jgi:large subunit ribosomal protein L18